MLISFLLHLLFHHLSVPFPSLEDKRYWPCAWARSILTSKANCIPFGCLSRHPMLKGWSTWHYIAILWLWSTSTHMSLSETGYSHADTCVLVLCSWKIAGKKCLPPNQFYISIVWILISMIFWILWCINTCSKTNSDQKTIFISGNFFLIITTWGSNCNSKKIQS